MPDRPNSESDGPLPEPDRIRPFPSPFGLVVRWSRIRATRWRARHNLETPNMQADNWYGK